MIKSQNSPWHHVYTAICYNPDFLINKLQIKENKWKVKGIAHFEIEKKKIFELKVHHLC